MGWVSPVRPNAERIDKGVNPVTTMTSSAPPTYLDILLEGRYYSLCMSTEEARLELLQGTLDLLILRTLQAGPAHGHTIAHAIELASDEVLQVEHGSLYPALHRLIKQSLITSEEGLSENNRKAKFYKLTAKGRKRLAEETSKWNRFAAAIGRVLRPGEV